MKTAALRAVAVAAYGAYWGLWTFGYLDVSRGEIPRMLFGALVMGAPCFLVGAAIGRWWAPAVGLIFVAFVPLPAHCVTSRDAPDAPFTLCHELYGSDLPLILALTTPCVLAGVAAVKIAARIRRPAPAA